MGTARVGSARWSGLSRHGHTRKDTGPPAPREADDPVSSEVWTQPRLSAVSSMTNDVWSEESSVPVKLIVTVWPAKDETLNERSV